MHIWRNYASIQTSHFLDIPDKKKPSHSP